MIVTHSITTTQIRAIHAALHRHGIEDETYRELLHNEYGVDTCKDLDRRQASRLLVHLPTPKQFQLIHDLRREVAWDHADGYRRWLKTCLGLDKVVDRDDASRVIQGLKGLKRGGHARRRHD